MHVGRLYGAIIIPFRNYVFLVFGSIMCRRFSSAVRCIVVERLFFSQMGCICIHLVVVKVQIFLFKSF